MRYLAPILLISFILISPAFAQETPSSAEASEGTDVVLPDPGLTPDSPFYFLDDFIKSIRLTFSFNAEKKIELRLKFAEEKLAEAEVMAREKKGEALEKALSRYEEHVIRAEERMVKLTEEKKVRIAERVANATARHFEVLERLRERAPERAKEALQKARDASEKGHLESIRALSERRPEKAAELTAKAMERRAKLAEKLADRKDSLAEKEAERLEKFAEFAEELKSKHENSPQDLKERIRVRLEEGMSQRDAVLLRVLDKVPDAAKPTIQRALDQSRRIENPRSLEEIKVHIERRRIERKEMQDEVSPTQLRSRLRVRTESMTGGDENEDRPNIGEGVKSIIQVPDIRVRDEVKDGETRIRVITPDDRLDIRDRIQIGE